MGKAVEMLCSVRALRHIEDRENLHKGSLAEAGMVHGYLAWSKDRENGKIKLVVADEFGEIVFKVGTKSSEEWVSYFQMDMPAGIRLISPFDFRGVVNDLRDF